MFLELNGAERQKKERQTDRNNTNGVYFVGHDSFHISILAWCKYDVTDLWTLCITSCCVGLNVWDWATEICRIFKFIFQSVCMFAATRFGFFKDQVVRPENWSTVKFNAIDRALQSSRKMCHRKIENVYGFPNMCFKWIFLVRRNSVCHFCDQSTAMQSMKPIAFIACTKQMFFFVCSFVRHWETSTMLTWSECTFFFRSFVHPNVRLARSLYVFL